MRANKLFIVFALTLALGSDQSRGHHTPGHDQNPSPPASLGPVDLVDFPTGSLIFPMDSCYQRPSFMAKSDLDEIVPITYEDGSLDNADVVCNGSSQKDDGIIPTYSLLAHLINEGVTVHWAIRDGKTGWHDYDFGVTQATGGPVIHSDKDLNTDTRYSGLVEIRYAGAPFVIHADDAAAAFTLMAGYNQAETGTHYGHVDIHIAQTDFQAPIFSSISGLPKLAVIDFSADDPKIENDKSSFLFGSIDEALMSDLENVFWYRVSAREVIDGRLISDTFSLAWVPPFDLKEGETPTADQLAFIAAMVAFADAGGHQLYQDGAVGAMEGHGVWSGSYDEKFEPTAGFHSDGGVMTNGVTSSWDNGNDDEVTVAQDYSDPASQFGGMFWTGIGGSKYNWMPRLDRAYHEGVRRMIYTDHQTDDTKDNWDIATWRHYANDSTKGRIYYLGGFHWRRVTAAGFRVLMNTIYVHASSSDDDSVNLEVARSAPIVATVAAVSTQFQGTFDAEIPVSPAETYSGSGDDATFVFPHITGHLRAIDVVNVTSTATAIEDVTAIFDAADLIPAVQTGGCGGLTYSGTCRTVFTNTTSGTSPTIVQVHTGSQASLSSLIDSGGSLSSTEEETLISRVLAGHLESGSYVAKLGGVDRSTMAVIESSPLAGSIRPTMIYVGATDGMLHAICAERLGVCTAGIELWAFLPRSQLSLLSENRQRIDGSPKVRDIFGDFNGDGLNTWKTILTFQTGNDESGGSAVYALDITDPASPILVWEYVGSGADTVDFGAGVGIAMAPVNTASGFREMTFVQTNNGGTSGAAGTYVVALDTIDSSVVWSKGIEHPNARDIANPNVPDTGIPGGVTLAAVVTPTSIDRVMVPTLYGELYVLNADDGTSFFPGDKPLFDFDEDFHPVGAPAALYKDLATNSLHAVIVSGGYVDSNPSSWSPSDVNQYGISVSLDTPEASVPLKLGTVSGFGFVLDFGAGQRGFSQAVIAGNELFIVTDSTDVNAADYGTGADTGTLRRFSLTDGTHVEDVSLRSGAASAEVVTGTGTAYTGGTSVQSAGLTSFDGSNTNTVELVFEAQTGREIWLRLL